MSSLPTKEVFEVTDSKEYFTLSTLVRGTLNASEEERNILPNPDVDLAKEDVALPFYFIFEKKKMMVPLEDGREVPAVYYHEIFLSCCDFCIAVNSPSELEKEYHRAHVENEDLLDCFFFTEEERKSDRVTKERLLTYLLWDNYNQGVLDSHGWKVYQKNLS